MKIHVLINTTLLAFAAAVAPQQVAAQSPAKVKPTLTISAGAVARVPWAGTLQAFGGVFAWQEASVSSRAAGLALTSVSADVGTAVRKGQVLAMFDDRSVRAEVLQAQASLEQSAATAAQAKTNRERALALAAVSAMSEQDVLQAVTLADTTQAQQAQARGVLMAATVKLENTVLRAPDSGVISARSATLGQVAAVGTELFRLIRQNRLEWRAELPAPLLGRVQAGQAAALMLPDGKRVTGRVRDLAPALDGTTRLGLVYVDLPATAGARASMYLTGELQISQGDALVVPSESVVIRDGRSYVFAINGNKVERKLVATGRRQDNQTEITSSGLQEGSKVAVRGAGFLNDGDTVQLAEAALTNAKPKAKP
jgi:RND family efflux transporter MFP subunit